MKKILISDNLSAEGIEIFKQTPGIEVDVKTKMTPEELKAVIGDYDGLVIRSATKVTQEVIDRAGKLAVIGRAGIGLDNVDIPAASKRGIVVMNTPGGNAVTTGEHTIAMMLSLVRMIPQATASMKAGKWEKSKFTGHEFMNKTLGIVGIGRVGSIVADRAQGLKMKVIAYDPFISPEAAQQMGITLASLDEIFRQADIITVHTPMTKETRGVINAAAFAKMKKGVYIINCARGGIVSEKDLYDALVSGKVAGAALDVFEEEPTKNTALIALDNVICTPHLGASTDEAQINVAIAIAEQIVAYLTTGEIKGAVNFPSVTRRAPGGDPPLSDPGGEAGKVRGTARLRRHQGGRHRVQRGDPQLQRRPDHHLAPQGAPHPDPQRERQLHQRPPHRQGAGHQGRRGEEQRDEGLHEHDLRHDQDRQGRSVRGGHHLRPPGAADRADQQIHGRGDPGGADVRPVQRGQARRHRQHRHDPRRRAASTSRGSI